MQHCHQVCPLEGGVPWKKAHQGGIRELDIMMDSDLTELDESSADGGKQQQMDDEYKISQQEFLELLNDVTEELQKEDELLEEEIWEMERAEAMKRERLMHQIDDFDSWEEQEAQYQHPQPSTYISPFANLNNSPLVTCPICNDSTLTQTPHDGIKCMNAAASSDILDKKCTFQLEIAHEGLTLNHLQDQLRTIYEEHSQVCMGILQFRMENRAGMSMLMAKCNVCSSDVVVL
ncbi:hypothetical protein ACHAXR_001017 [Thalassiosira sp. AJA248-18]